MTALLEHISFTARLKLLSDLHIGTGETQSFAELRDNSPRNREGEPPQVATIVRAADGAPIIPGTALKGALRKAVLAAHGKDILERLFGGPKNTPIDAEPGTEAGQIGLVWLRFAPLIDALTGGDRPYWDPAKQTVITTHVAIARKTGTAAEQKLFHVERVPEGAFFELRGVYIGARAEAELDLPIALGPLARREGLGVGADEKQGGGRLVFDKPVLKCRRRYFDAATGEVRSEASFEMAVSPIAGSPAPASTTMTLYCRGPYLTVDPSRRQGNEIPAARRNTDTPLLPASSLLGVLRARAAWLAALEGKDAVVDDPERVLATGEDPKGLSRTQRLFGVAGWRGLVRVVRIEVQESRPCEDLPSVVIDRFSGGTLDSALYTVEAFSHVRVAVELRLDRRCWGKREWPSDEDAALFNRLIDDLCAEGIMLGHGVNRGFGWFEVTKA